MADEVQRAKELCIDLLENVRQQYNAFKERGPRGGGDYGDRGYNRGGYDRGDRHRNSYDGNYGGNYGGGGGSGYGGAQSPPGGAAGHAMSPAGGNGTPGTDYSAAYAQYYANGQDPYAAYGGYEAYCRMYMQYMQQQQGQQGTAAQSPTPGAYDSSAAPPPPPSNEAPPPPPPSNSAPPPPPGAGVYNAVSSLILMPRFDVLLTYLGPSSPWHVKRVWVQRCQSTCVIHEQGPFSCFASQGNVERN